MRGLFSFRGRLNRGAWWLRVGVALLAPAVFGMAMAFVIPQLHALGPAATTGVAGQVIAGLAGLFLLVIPVLIVTFASVRRLHDMERSGWLLVLGWFVIPPALVGLALISGVPAVLLGAQLVQLGSVIALGSIPGTIGPNRYGPDPLDPLADLSDDNIGAGQGST